MGDGQYAIKTFSWGKLKLKKKERLNRNIEKQGVTTDGGGVYAFFKNNL